MLDEVLRTKSVTTKRMVPNRENVEVDDLVLELDPNQKGSRWKLARAVPTYPGNDGLVRKSRIKTQSSEYDRPIHKLCLIATKEEMNTDAIFSYYLTLDTIRYVVIIN